VKEIASKNASADFQNFCRLASKKGAESAVFFGFEGTLLGNTKFYHFWPPYEKFLKIPSGSPWKDPSDAHGIRVYLLRLLCFYQTYCTLVVHYCHVTRGDRLRFQI